MSTTRLAMASVLARIFRKTDFLSQDAAACSAGGRADMAWSELSPPMRIERCRQISMAAGSPLRGFIPVAAENARQQYGDTLTIVLICHAKPGDQVSLFESQSACLATEALIGKHERPYQVYVPRKR